MWSGFRLHEFCLLTGDAIVVAAAAAAAAATANCLAVAD
jgi:hypothetical protein